MAQLDTAARIKRLLVDNQRLVIRPATGGDLVVSMEVHIGSTWVPDMRWTWQIAPEQLEATLGRMERRLLTSTTTED